MSTINTYLSYIRGAIRAGNTTAEADDEKFCKEDALFKGKVDVCLKGASFPLVRRLGKFHSKDA